MLKVVPNQYYFGALVISVFRAFVDITTSGFAILRATR